MQNDKKNIGEKIGDFVQRNRRGIFLITGLVIFLFAGFIVFITVQDAMRKKAISEVEELYGRFEEMRYFPEDNYYTSDINTLLAETEEFAKKKSGFAGSRAWSIVAQIYSGRGDWQKSEEAWLNAAKAGEKTYLGPISFFSAAAAAEEQGKIEKAIEYLEKCIASPFEFPAAARAQFSVGRLYEQLNNYPAATAAYREVLINWDNVPVWQHLARSRLAVIEAR